MYCPFCGVEYAQKLNYCKRCGAGLSLPTSQVESTLMRPPRFGYLFWAISALGLGGLGIVVGLIATMASFGIQGEDLIIVFIVSLTFIFGLAGLLIRQLSRVTSAYHEAIRTANTERPAVTEYRPTQINAPPETPSSVVEPTTRQFAPSAYKEPIPRQ